MVKTLLMKSVCALSLLCMAFLLSSCGKMADSPTAPVPASPVIPTFVHSWYFNSPETLDMYKGTLMVATEYELDLYNFPNLASPTQRITDYRGNTFCDIYAAAFSPLHGNIYGLDYDCETVYQYTFNGAPMNSNSYFYYPEGIASDSAGNYYVADSDNGRVEEFSPNNKFMHTWYYFNGGSLSYPIGVALDSHNNLYVSDEDNEEIFEFKAGTDTLLNTWYLPSDDNVYQMAIATNGTIYAADVGPHRLRKYVKSK